MFFRPIRNQIPGLWLTESEIFLASPLQPLKWVRWILTESQVLNVLYQVCVFWTNQKTKMAILTFHWLRNFWPDCISISAFGMMLSVCLSDVCVKVLELALQSRHTILTSFLFTSPLQPLKGIWQNLTWRKYTTSSCYSMLPWWRFTTSSCWLFLQVEIQDMEVNSVIEMVIHVMSTMTIQLQTLSPA